MNGDDDLYDEFGNYLGPELAHASDSNDDSDSQKSDDSQGRDRSVDEAPLPKDGEQPDQNMVGDSENEEYYKHGAQIVLHEDKQYYPDAE